MTTARKRRVLFAALTALAFACVALGHAAKARATAPGRDGRIVFRRYLDIGKTTSAIFTVNPDDTQEQQVTRPPSGVDDREPDWSPSGAQIAFERKVPCPAGGSKDGLNSTCDLVYTVNRGGRHLKALVRCGFDASAPFPGNCVGVDDAAWSPDGSRIAFQYNLADEAYSGSLGLDAGIWTVRTNGLGFRPAVVARRTQARLRPLRLHDAVGRRVHGEPRRKRRAPGHAVAARRRRSSRLVAGRTLASVPGAAR
jgi:dipeptidyl aminopeptidase/acylaminoacyl peptidase